MHLVDKEIDIKIEKPRELYTTIAVSNQNVEELPTEEWLHWRQHGPHWRTPDHPDYIELAFGGSDIGTIRNVNKWKSALQLYHEKLGIEPAINVPNNKVQLELGHIYEHTVGKKFELWMRMNHPDIQFKMYYDKRMFRCMKKDQNGNLATPYCLMDVDGLMTISYKGETATIIYEAKTVDKSNFETINNAKKGIIPPQYYNQLMYYMYGMNLTAAVIVFSWGHGMDEMAVVWVERNYDAEEEMIRDIDCFASCIKNEIEPDTKSMNQLSLNKYYAYFLPEPPQNAKAVMLGAAYADNVNAALGLYEERKKLENQLKELKEKESQYVAAFASIFGTTSTAIFELDENKYVEIVLKRSHFSDKADEEKLKAENPTLYQQYIKQTFDYTSFKRGESKEVVEAYTVKGGINPNPPAAQAPRFELKVKEKRNSRKIK